MKKMLMAAVAALLLSCSDGGVCDKVMAVYEGAAEKVLAASNKEEFRVLEREQNAECSKALRHYAVELAELEQKAADGNRRATAQLKKLNAAKKFYRDSKAEKRKAFKTN